VTLRADGWPDAHGEAELPAGQQTEVTVNFPSGSLHVESEPAGATLKLGKSVLGKTPLTVPQLPPGEHTLSLETPLLPAFPFTTTIAASEQATATVRLPRGKLIVESTPAGATVLMGGRAYGQTPLFFQDLPPGVAKLTLQAKDFPPLEIAATVVDREEVTVRAALGAGFPVLDPAELLRAVWISDNPNRIVEVFNTTTGIYRPKNGVVKNLKREALYNYWLRKSYRFSGQVKSYDSASGKVEFEEQKSELSRYRVLAQVTPGADLGGRIRKDAAVSLYGRLTAVEEPAWPLRVITLELSNAELLPEETAEAGATSE
jgi:hypothetical protein